MPILLKNQFVNSREEILEVETPQPLTETHVPIEHSFFLEQADKNFEENNLTIKEENMMNYNKKITLETRKKLFYNFHFDISY